MMELSALSLPLFVSRICLFRFRDIEDQCQRVHRGRATQSSRSCSFKRPLPIDTPSAEEALLLFVARKGTPMTTIQATLASDKTMRKSQLDEHIEAAVPIRSASRSVCSSPREDCESNDNHAETIMPHIPPATQVIWKKGTRTYLPINSFLEAVSEPEAVARWRDEGNTSEAEAIVRWRDEGDASAAVFATGNISVWA